MRTEAEYVDKTVTGHTREEKEMKTEALVDG